MKLIEGLKKIKDLQRKAEDIRDKIGAYSVHLSFETPRYPDQKKQVKEWLQAHSDLLKEILKLRIAIQRTNLETQVAVELDGKTVTKSIAEWIHRRRDLAKQECAAWQALTDRNLKEGMTKDTQGEKVEIKIVRCYEPEERDEKVDAYLSEPSTIDARLEITNAITDLIE